MSGGEDFGNYENPKLILSHGLELNSLGKMEVEYLEKMDSILGVCSIPMPKKAWTMYAEHFASKARKAQTTAQTERWRVCEMICKRMPDESSAWDALVMLEEIERETGNAWCDGYTREMFRVEHHKATHKEWVGRQIG